MISLALNAHVVLYDYIENSDSAITNYFESDKLISAAVAEILTASTIIVAAIVTQRIRSKSLFSFHLRLHHNDLELWLLANNILERILDSGLKYFVSSMLFPELSFSYLFTLVNIHGGVMSS